MRNKTNIQRMGYAAAFMLILVIEAGIALFVRDSFIRPYGGDVLVVILLCCFIRIFIPERIRLLPLWVFLFAAAVEVGQYYDFVSLLGLGELRFFRVLMGSTFSIVDILCYALGCTIFFLCEKMIDFLSEKGHN